MHRYSFWAAFASVSFYISTPSSCPNMVFITELHKPGYVHLLYTVLFWNHNKTNAVQSLAFLQINEVLSPDWSSHGLSCYVLQKKPEQIFCLQCAKTKIFHLHWHKSKNKQQLHIWEAETRLYLAFILDKSQQLSTNLMLLTNSLSVWQF